MGQSMLRVYFDGLTVASHRSGIVADLPQDVTHIIICIGRVGRDAKRSFKHAQRAFKL